MGDAANFYFGAYIYRLCINIFSQMREENVLICVNDVVLMHQWLVGWFMELWVRKHNVFCGSARVLVFNFTTAGMWQNYSVRSVLTLSA